MRQLKDEVDQEFESKRTSQECETSPETRRAMAMEEEEIKKSIFAEKLGFDTQDDLKKVEADQLWSLPEDPISVFGFGVIAFRGVLWTSFVLMVILSVFQLPALYIFSSGEGFNLILSQKHIEYIGSTLGNLGYSSVQCN